MSTDPEKPASSPDPAGRPAGSAGPTEPIPPYPAGPADPPEAAATAAPPPPRARRRFWGDDGTFSRHRGIWITVAAFLAACLIGSAGAAIGFALGRHSGHGNVWERPGDRGHGWDRGPGRFFRDDRPDGNSRPRPPMQWPAPAAPPAAPSTAPSAVAPPAPAPS